MEQSENMNNNESQKHNNALLTEFRSLFQESNIVFQMDDKLLLCFIRARKYNLHRALKMLNNYLKMVRNHPELFTDLRPARLKAHLDLGHLLVAPHRERNGRRILIINARDWNIRVCKLDDVLRLMVYCFQRTIAETETQINGVVLILDFKDFTLQQVRHVTPAFLKKFASLIQDVFPMRLLGIHVVHEPWALKILVSMIWPFLSHKIRSRLFFHGDCFETLHQHVDPAFLPSDYDGWLGPMDAMHFSKVLHEENYSKIFDCFN